LPTNDLLIYRDYTRIYMKELALHLCRLDFSWVKSAFRNTLTAALNSLCLKREGDVP
jgi:hypothetical protein